MRKIVSFGFAFLIISTSTFLYADVISNLTQFNAASFNIKYTGVVDTVITRGYGESLRGYPKLEVEGQAIYTPNKVLTKFSASNGCTFVITSDIKSSVFRCWYKGDKTAFDPQQYLHHPGELTAVLTPYLDLKLISKLITDDDEIKQQVLQNAKSQIATTSTIPLPPHKQDENSYWLLFADCVMTSNSVSSLELRENGKPEFTAISNYNASIAYEASYPLYHMEFSNYDPNHWNLPREVIASFYQAITDWDNREMYRTASLSINEITLLDNPDLLKAQKEWTSGLMEYKIPISGNVTVPIWRRSILLQIVLCLVFVALAVWYFKKGRA